MRRREFVAGLTAAVVQWQLPAWAQAAMRRIGVLLPGSPESPFGQYPSFFKEGLAELGYVEGRDFVLELRWTDAHNDRLPALARDLVDRKVDLILATSVIAAQAAAEATATIPIVQGSGGSPVRTGMAASLSRPQGNLTGFTNQSEDISGKLLELLLTAVPGTSRVGALLVPGVPVTEPQLRQIQDAARALSVTIHPVGVSKSNELEGAFATLSRERVRGLVVFSAALLVSLSETIVKLAEVAKLPTIYPYRSFATRGGLMSYGIDHRQQYRHAARLVDRIFKGARPSDLPVEQPTKFELVINLKTSKALGLSMPPTLLARADEVIE